MKNGIDISRLGFTSIGAVASEKGRVLICGSARCLWDDLKLALNAYPSVDVMAVKQSGMHLPMRFKHWAGAHGERFQYMVPLRYEGYYFMGGTAEQRNVHPQKLGVTIHSDKKWPLVDHVWPCKLTGTSALFATRVALALGYEEVVLCGVPLDETGRYYSAPWDKGVSLNVVDMKEWEEYVPVFEGRVKSMSGRTRELLGGV